MAWIVAFLFLGSSPVFALSAKDLAVKIDQLLDRPCASSPVPSGIDINIVYFRGGPVDTGNAPEAGQKLLNITKFVSEDRGIELNAVDDHHSAWEKYCERLSLKESSRVYLVGHSYGAAGVNKLARCLKERSKKVSIMFTISSYDFMSGIDVRQIPGNVINHFNFYTTDPSIPGYNNHQADDPQSTHIENILAEQNSGFPHRDVAENLVGLIGLQIFADLENQLSCLKIPKVFNAVVADDQLAQFWQ